VLESPKGSLTNVTIPNSVTFISDSLSNGCTNLTSGLIPDSVTSIGIRAFSSKQRSPTARA
jgi:hypothetical protein